MFFAFSSIFIFSIIDKNISTILYALILTLIAVAVLTTSKMPSYTREYIELYSNTKSKFFFFDDFIIFCDESKILKWNYDYLKYIFENDNYIYMKTKLKSTKFFDEMPIIIDKKNLSPKEEKFLKEKLNIKKGL